MRKDRNDLRRSFKKWCLCQSEVTKTHLNFTLIEAHFFFSFLASIVFLFDTLMSYHPSSISNTITLSLSHTHTHTHIHTHIHTHTLQTCPILPFLISNLFLTYTLQDQLSTSFCPNLNFETHCHQRLAEEWQTKAELQGDSQWKKKTIERQTMRKGDTWMTWCEWEIRLRG